MAYPFKPLTNEDLEKISRQIKNLILAIRKSRRRFVISFPKDHPTSKNNTTPLKNRHSEASSLSN